MLACKVLENDSVRPTFRRPVSINSWLTMMHASATRDVEISSLIVPVVLLPLTLISGLVRSNPL